MGTLACLGMTATLIVTFTVMPAVMQLMDDRRKKQGIVEMGTAEQAPTQTTGDAQ